MSDLIAKLMTEVANKNAESKFELVAMAVLPSLDSAIVVIEEENEYVRWWFHERGFYWGRYFTHNKDADKREWALTNVMKIFTETVLLNI